MIGEAKLPSIIQRAKRFFRTGEEEAFGRLNELAGLGEEALGLLVKILAKPHSHNEAGESEDLTEVSFYTQKISALEKEGDVLSQSLEELLGKGSISASSLNEFDRLIDNVDDILDSAHSLSRQLKRVTKHPLRETKEVEDSIRKGQVELVEIGLKQVRMLRELLALAGRDMVKATDLAREIEKLEEQGDDVKDAMLDEIYGSWQKLDYASFHNFIETTIEADDILDGCEDASDLIVTIMKSLGA